MESTAIEVDTEVIGEDNSKKVNTVAKNDPENITFCELCCPKGQDFDPANPLDWLASLLSLAFFLLAFFSIKYLLVYYLL